MEVFFRSELPVPLRCSRAVNGPRQPNAWTAAVLRNELDTGRFEGEHKSLNDQINEIGTRVLRQEAELQGRSDGIGKSASSCCEMSSSPRAARICAEVTSIALCCLVA